MTRLRQLTTFKISSVLGKSELSHVKKGMCVGKALRGMGVGVGGNVYGTIHRMVEYEEKIDG